MNNTELTFLIFVITFGIGIVTGYLLKYMPNKDEEELKNEKMHTTKSNPEDFQYGEITSDKDEVKEPVSCRYYKESDCWYFKTKCYGLPCNAYVTKEG